MKRYIIILMLLLLVQGVTAVNYATVYNYYTGTFDFYTLDSNNYTGYIDCSIINFSGSVGAAGICDGVDSTSGSGGENFWIDGGTYIYINSSYASNAVVNGSIKADDWTNVTITMSQISDYSSANTNCSVAGSCPDVIYDTNTSWVISTVNTSSYYGLQVNWSNVLNKLITAISGNYLYFDGTTLSFNESVLNATIEALDTDTYNTTAEMQTAVNSSDLFYNIDVDTLDGQDGAYYLDNTNTNCSASDSCSEIVYYGNTTWITSNQNNDGNTNCSVSDSCSEIVYYGNTSWVTANEADASHDECSEITNCVENALTNVTMNHSVNCANIDGATSNLCSITDTNVTDTYNTTADMQNAVNSSSVYYQIKVGWANILNRFITAVDTVWIYMDGTTATFNETYLYANVYNETEIDTSLAAQDECSEITGCVSSAFDSITNFTGTLTDTKICAYDAANTIINCTTENAADGNTNCSVAGSCPSVIYDTNTSWVQANELDADHDTCAEITGCVENAVTNVSMNHSVNCANIDGSTSNLCSITDTNTTDTNTNCSASDSCSEIVYYGNTTWITANQDPDTNTNCSSSDSCSEIVYYGNTSWITDNQNPDTYNTTEDMQDAAGAMATNGDGVDFAYDDGAATLTPSFDCSDIIGDGVDCSGEDVIFDCSEVTGDGTDCSGEDLIFDCSEVLGGGLECDGEDLVVSDNYLNLTGGTMTGDITMGSKEILDVNNITMDVDATNHYIYDNATCIVIKGDTSTLSIC